MKFMMQDCLMAKGELCTAGSGQLFNFKAPFSATVYEKCLAAGLDFAGCVTPDELSIDALFDEADPQDAAIAALLAKECDAVLCNDVFGKLRRQGPVAGLLYIQPAYGTVSRFGLIPAVSSMDQVGVLCRSIEDGLAVLNVISGHDANDGTALPVGSYSYSAAGTPSPMKAAAVSELPYFDVMAQSFYILATAEISNNSTRYDGVNIGYRAEDPRNIQDLYVRSRSESLGREIKLASLVGCMVLSQEYYDSLYDKAMRVRRIVRDDYAELLSKAGTLAIPTAAEGGKFAQSSLYAIATLCGFASVALPAKDGAVQLLCKRGEEDAMFALTKEILL